MISYTVTIRDAYTLAELTRMLDAQGFAYTVGDRYTISIYYNSKSERQQIESIIKLVGGK